MLWQRRRLACGLLTLLLVGSIVVSSSVRRGLENAWIGWPIAEGFNRYRPWAYRARDSECVGALARTSLRFALLPEDRFPADCPAVLPVAIEWPLSERRFMNCGLALALHGYWEGALRPLARRMLGRELVGIGDLGVRSCRPMSGHRFLLSEHGLSNAIDLDSFYLDDGEVIDVARGWTGGGLEAAFLREAARAACNHFSMVISPDHDETHRDHLHLDLGLSEGCKVDGAPLSRAGPEAAAGLPPCLELGPGQTPAQVIRGHAPEDEELLSRLVYAEAHSTTFPSDRLVHRALAWGVMNRVRLGHAYPERARVYGRGVTEVILKPKQFAPAVSRNSRYAPLFLCPDDPERFALANSAAREALVGEGNPFIETAWERDHGLSLVVNFYYPSSPQARGPAAPWEGDPELALLRHVEIDGEALSLDRVRFYRKTESPE